MEIRKRAEFQFGSEPIQKGTSPWRESIRSQLSSDLLGDALGILLEKPRGDGNTYNENLLKRGFGTLLASVHGFGADTMWLSYSSTGLTRARVTQDFSANVDRETDVEFVVTSIQKGRQSGEL